MSCDICGRGACMAGFHSREEQERYEKVIEAFDRARDLRERVRADAEDSEDERQTCRHCGGPGGNCGC